MPISSTLRGHLFEVALGEAMQTQGFIHCQQVRTMDFRGRFAQFIEKAPVNIVNEALARVAALIKPED